MAFAKQNATQALEDIEQQVLSAAERYLSGIYGMQRLENDIELSLSNLDPRLTLPACPQPLNIELQQSQYGGSKLSAKVHCPDGARWTIYVPVNVDIYTEVAISTRNLRKGERISKHDFNFQRTNTSDISHSFLDSPEDLVGKEVRRPLRAGAVIRDQDLQEANVVEKGDTVIVTAQSGGLMVSTEGEALTDGHVGEQIRVKNLRSNRIVDARVMGPGEAQVDRW